MTALLLMVSKVIQLPIKWWQVLYLVKLGRVIAFRQWVQLLMAVHILVPLWW